MTIAAAPAPTWGRSPARSWPGSWLTSWAGGVTGLVIVAAGVYGLATGHIRGGRIAGAALVPYGAALIAIVIPVLRRRGQMWRSAVALALILPAKWFDAWLNHLADPRVVPVIPTILAGWLLLHRLRWRPPGAAAEPTQPAAGPAVDERPR